MLISTKSDNKFVCSFMFINNRESLKHRKASASKRQPLVSKSFTVPSSAGRRKKMEMKKNKGFLFQYCAECYIFHRLHQAFFSLDRARKVPRPV